MKTYIASVSLSGTLREKIEAAAAAGFAGIEVFENDLLTFDGTTEDVRRVGPRSGYGNCRPATL